VSTVDLDPKWTQWITENLARGCAVNDMVAAMCAAGFAEPVARMAIVGSNNFHPAGRLPSLEWPPCQIAIADRPVSVLLALRRPRLAVIGGFLDSAECDLIIRLSTPKLEPSKVVSNSDGKAELDAVRTSFGTYFVRGETPELWPIEARLAALTGMPVEHGEGLQVLRYGAGAQYVPHFDFFPPEVPGSATHVTAALGGQRVATVVMYLNTVSAGGETEFPEVGCKVAAIQGNACFFSYMAPDGSLDRSSLHGGNPVLAGEKWIATWWMRHGPYGAASVP
jgi:prolyl 4-hydroxylase